MIKTGSTLPCVNSLNSNCKEFSGSSSISSTSQLGNAAGSKDSSKKSVLEVKIDATETVIAPDGGLSAWLIVFAAFWIFFIMVMKYQNCCFLMSEKFRLYVCLIDQGFELALLVCTWLTYYLIIHFFKR